MSMETNKCKYFQNAMLIQIMRARKREVLRNLIISYFKITVDILVGIRKIYLYN